VHGGPEKWASTGIALSGRAGLLTLGILQLLPLFCVVLAGLLLLTSLVARCRGRRAARVFLGLAFGLLVALGLIGPAVRWLALS
jgi:hypothetical protein